MRCSPFALLFALAFVFVLSSPTKAEKILTITSEPTGAVVEINGKNVGVTPIETKMKEFWFNGPKYLWSEFLNTPMQMTVSKEGYIPQTITITAGPYRWVNANYTAEKIYYVIEQTSFHIILQKVGATNASPYSDERTPIVVSSEPSGAEIHVDGQFDSSTPSKLLLTPGAHTITVIRPGFRPWQRVINVEPGTEKTFNALLERGEPNSNLASGPSPQTALGQKPELIVETGHGAPVSALAFSPDGKIFASGSADAVIKLWDVKSGLGLRTLTGESLFSTESSGISALAFSPDGRILAGTIVKPVHNEDGDSSLVTDIIFWDVVSGNKLSAIAEQAGIVLSIAFSIDGRLLAGGNADGTVTIWDLGSGRAVRSLTGHNSEVDFVMFTPDGIGLLSGSFAKGLKLWDVINSKVSKEIGGNPVFKLDPILDSMNQGSKVTSMKVAFSPAANKFAFADVFEFKVSIEALSSELTVLDGEHMVVEKKHKVEEGGVSSIAFNPSGKILAIGKAAGSVELRSVDTWTNLLAIKGGKSSDAIAMSPDSRIIAQSSWDGGKSIKLWDTNNESELKILTGHTDDINSLAFSPDGRTLASGSDDKTIRLWDVESGSAKTLKGHTNGVGYVAFSPDGKILASIADNVDEDDDDKRDKAVRLWDVASASEVKSLIAADNAPSSIAFSPNGRMLAVGNLNKTISLVDVESGSVVKTLSGHIGEVESVIFVNAETLQSISSDEKENYAVYLWNLSTDSPPNVYKDTDTNGNALFFLGNDMPSFAIGEKFYAVSLDTGGIALFRKVQGHMIDFSPQNELARLYLFDNNNWLITTPEGYFDGSPGGWKRAHWRFNGSTFDNRALEHYFNEFFYPNLLQEVIAGKTPKPPAGPKLEEIDRRQPSVLITDINGHSNSGPDARPVSPFQTDKRMATVTIEVADNLDAPKRSDHAASSGAQDLRLFRNGSLVHIWHNDLFSLGAKEGCEQVAPDRQNEPRRVRCRVDVPVVAGDNQFTAYAFNRQKVKSEDSQFSIRGAATLKRDRTLYVLTIGVGQYENPEFNLNYTVNDAQAFGAEVRRQQEQIGYYQKVEVIPLLDQGARKDFILSALKTLAEAVQPEDGVIIYFSGHGTAQGDRFYLIPSDLGYKGPRSQVEAAGLQTILAHSISDLELEDAFTGIDAGLLLLVIDSCNSGKALQADDWRRGPMDTKGLGQLAYEKGMYVLTASQDVELAYESEALKHSYLTYVLVEEGLKSKVGEADANDDGEVILREWLDYAKRRVPRMRQEKVEQIALQQNKSLEEVEVVEEGKVQQPRVFYRREPELQPFIVAKPRRESSLLNN